MNYTRETEFAQLEPNMYIMRIRMEHHARKRLLRGIRNTLAGTMLLLGFVYVVALAASKAWQ